MSQQFIHVGVEDSLLLDSEVFSKVLAPVPGLFRLIEYLDNPVAVQTDLSDPELVCNQSCCGLWTTLDES